VLRLRTMRPSPAVAAVILAILIAATTAALAAIPDSSGTITACYSRQAHPLPLGERKGAVRLIDPSRGEHCQSDENSVTWNQRGPQGERGPTGAQGAAGPTGPRGPAGTVDTSAFYTKTEADDRFLASSAIASGEFGSTASTNGATRPGVGGSPPCLVGMMMPFASEFPPDGWGFANGQEVPIRDYEVLFNVIGTTYGGDGVTTFALPNAHDVGPGHTNWMICMVGEFPVES